MKFSARTDISKTNAGHFCE